VPACCWGRSIGRQHALSARFDDGPAAPPAETKNPGFGVLLLAIPAICGKCEEAFQE
jgi:hypothetical protein